MPNAAANPRTLDREALALACAALALVLFLHLTLALLAGMLLYTVGVELREWLERRIGLEHAAAWSVAALLVLLIAGIAALLQFVPQALGAGGSASEIAEQAGIALERLRDKAPAWLAAQVPQSVEAIRALAVEWLRAHAKEVQLVGTETLRGVAHLIVGAIIGTLAVLQTRGSTAQPTARTPWLAALAARFTLFAQSFEAVAYAQIRIAAVNAALLAAYVLVVLPWLGKPLPLAWTLVGFTFVASLIPIVGNLVSNTLVVVLSLTHGIGTAIGSLAFLIAVHKLEYFLNAHIVGRRVHTKAFEMLAVMLVFEAAFGVPGLVAAPVIYAYAKAELRATGWI